MYIASKIAQFNILQLLAVLGKIKYFILFRPKQQICRIYKFDMVIWIMDQK